LYCHRTFSTIVTTRLDNVRKREAAMQTKIPNALEAITFERAYPGTITPARSAPGSGMSRLTHVAPPPGRAGLGTSVVIGRGGLVEGDAGA
jgi:hypothetical protein